MMKTRCLFAAIFALGLTGCIPDKLNTEPEVKGLKVSSGMQTYINPEAEFSVSLEDGERFRLKLDSNPTTGYRWFILPGWNDRFIDLIEDEYKSDANPLGMVGVGGTQIYTFKARAAGKTDLKLIYARDPGVSADPDHIIHVTVAK